jgi:hypothetical protein
MLDSIKNNFSKVNPFSTSGQTAIQQKVKSGIANPTSTISEAQEKKSDPKKTNKSFVKTLVDAVCDIIKAIAVSIKVIFLSLIPIENIFKRRNKKTQNALKLENFKRQLEWVDDISKVVAEVRANNINFGFDPFEEIGNRILEKQHRASFRSFFSNRKELPTEEKKDLGRKEFEKQPELLKALLKEYYEKQIKELEKKLK